MSPNSCVRFFVVAIVIFSRHALADIATDSAMAREALIPYVGTQKTLDMALRSSYQKNAAASTIVKYPDREVSASLVFDRGLSLGEAVALVEDSSLKLLGVELKAPLGAEGQINSISLGADYLLATDGSLDYRLSFALGLARGVMMDLLTGMEGRERDDYYAMATGEFKVYGMSVFGRADDLRSLLQRSETVYMRIDPGRGRIDDYTRLQKSTARTPRKFQLVAPPER